MTPRQLQLVQRSFHALCDRRWDEAFHRALCRLDYRWCKLGKRAGRPAPARLAALTALGVRALSEPLALISFLTELRAAGVPDAERDLPVVHEALVAVLQAKLGDSFDPETALAWWAALQYMAELAAPAPAYPRSSLLRLDAYARPRTSRTPAVHG